MEYGNFRVQKFTDVGAYLAQWGGMGGAGSSTGHWHRRRWKRQRLRRDGSQLRIQQYTSAGTYVMGWGIGCALG